MIPVCIFAKPPECGKVKTRLIGKLGEKGASGLAAAMFQDVWDVVTACPGVISVLATTAEGIFPVPVERERVWLQAGDCLGARLENIFRRGLDCACAAIAIGADSPSLTVSHLEIAVQALDRHDAVIGRSLDGGFYLLGVRQCEDGLLAELPWSTSQTAEATIARLKERGRSVHELPPLFDVDVPDDLELLAAYLLTDRQAAPATRAWAKSTGLLKDGD
jgi:uncharacterized protein